MGIRCLSSDISRKKRITANHIFEHFSEAPSVAAVRRSHDIQEFSKIDDFEIEISRRPLNRFLKILIFWKDEIQYFHVERVSAFAGICVDAFHSDQVVDFSKIGIHSPKVFATNILVLRNQSHRHREVISLHDV